MHMHRTIVWWSLWGLFMGIGLFGLKESSHHSIHFIAAFPILTGAIAAAVLRIKHEYHEVMMHAKWVAVSTGFLLLGSGYMYVKAQAYGPFATASPYKAFMGSTFEMSVHEVERALGHSLETTSADRNPIEGIKEWALMLWPDFEAKTDNRTLSDLIIYKVPAKARFDFAAGKLGKVEIQFRPTASAETSLLVQHVQEDLDKDYKHVDVVASASDSSMLYRKEAVEATVAQTAVDNHHQQVSVILQYLPFVDKTIPPLTVEAKAF